jgi:hypothetical protein
MLRQLLVGSAVSACDFQAGPPGSPERISPPDLADLKHAS